MNEVPTVTVLIPARNEERDIERCLRAVLAQDHPHDRMEIVLVDGRSTDRTAAVAAEVLSEGDIDWKIIDNPAGTTPSNLNAGLGVAIGDVLCRVDARSIVPPEYVRLCAELLMWRSDVAVTGGAQVAVVVRNSPVSGGIARALNNRYVMGGSRYRSGAPSGPSDTVYLGAFRSAELRAAGGWNEAMLTNQDYELNRRMGTNGVVWFDARLRVGYLPRQSLDSLWRQYVRFGRWKVKYWRATGDMPQPRQLVPLALPPLTGVATLGAVLRSRDRLRTCAAMGVAGLVSIAVLDTVGVRSVTPASVRVRLVGMMASVIILLGWLSGVWSELFGPIAEGCQTARRMSASSSKESIT